MKKYIVLQYGNTIHSRFNPSCYAGADIFDTYEDANTQLAYKERVWTQVNEGNIWNVKKTKNKVVIKYYNGTTDTFEIIERSI